MDLPHNNEGHSGVSTWLIAGALGVLCVAVGSVVLVGQQPSASVSRIQQVTARDNRSVEKTSVVATTSPECDTVSDAAVRDLISAKTTPYVVATTSYATTSDILAVFVKDGNVRTCGRQLALRYDFINPDKANTLPFFESLFRLSGWSNSDRDLQHALGTTTAEGHLVQAGGPTSESDEFWKVNSETQTIQFLSIHEFGGNFGPDPSGNAPFIRICPCFQQIAIFLSGTIPLSTIRSASPGSQI